jgi:hypothetical protein
MLENLRERWSRNYGELLRNRRRGAVPADNPEFSPRPPRKHKKLLKHESSLLVRICTGKVGPQAFLFQTLEIAGCDRYIRPSVGLPSRGLVWNGEHLSLYITNAAMFVWLL